MSTDKSLVDTDVESDNGSVADHGGDTDTTLLYLLMHKMQKVKMD